MTLENRYFCSEAGGGAYYLSFYLTANLMYRKKPSSPSSPKNKKNIASRVSSSIKFNCSRISRVFKDYMNFQKV